MYYETLEAFPTGGGTYYRCRRSLVEIKTPWKLRNRQNGADFYPLCHQRNGRANCIPFSYYDQVQGNAWLMGLGYIYFVVFAPSGFHVVVEPYTQGFPCWGAPVRDPVYVNQQLLPALVSFWKTQVLPAFDQRDSMPPDQVAPGWMPPCPRKHALGA